MRICLATTHFEPIPGGISHYYTCLSRLLTEAGHSVILLTIATDNNQTEDRIIEEGAFIKVILVKDYQRYLRHYSTCFRPGSYAAGQWIATGMAMRDWLLKNAADYQIDLIETMDYGGAGIFLKQTGLPPLIIDAHSSAIQIDREYPMHPDDHLAVIKKLEALSFTYAEAIIAHSPMNLEELKAMGYNHVLFCRAPWLLPEDIQTMRQPRKNNFLVIGSLQMIKGAGLMTHAASIAGKDMEELCIYWVGGDSYSAPGGKLTSLYLQEKYPDTWGRQFVWLDQKSKEEIAKLVSETEAVIIPSLWDTFNYVVPETIVSGTPLIVSDKTGAAYLVKDHQQAVLFRAGDPVALAGIIAGFKIAEQQASNEISATQSLAAYFNHELIIRERITLYEQISKNAVIHNQAEITKSLKFLDRYITPWRKYYYSIRKKLKTLIRSDFNNLKN